MPAPQQVYVLNGPNLNLLGKRETGIYGTETLQDIEKACHDFGVGIGLSIVFRQTNSEGTLIDWIQEASENAAGILINPAAYTHTSVGVHDALKVFGGPIIEVHISNVHQRESFRRHSYVSLLASGVIAGCGAQGYEFGLRRLAHLLRR